MSETENATVGCKSQQLTRAQDKTTMQPMVAGAHSTTFGERLDRALDYAGAPTGRERRGAVAKMFGVSRESARKWLSDESIPDVKRLPSIAERLGVRTEWLLSGAGEMVRAEFTIAEPSAAYTTSRAARALSGLQRAVEEGKLADEDLELLCRIAERLTDLNAGQK